MAELDSTARMRQSDIEVTEKLYSLEKAQDTERRIRDIQASSPASFGIVDTRKRPVSTAALERFNRKRELSKRQALDRTLQILIDNPEASPSEIAAQIGKSRQTVYDYFDELEAAGRLHRNGSTTILR
jgi:predicted HTH transcriptional regulator